MWIYLKNNWVLFILKMSGSRGSPCTICTFIFTVPVQGWYESNGGKSILMEISRNVHYTVILVCLIPPKRKGHTDEQGSSWCGLLGRQNAGRRKRGEKSVFYINICWACGAYGWGEGGVEGKPEGKTPLGRPRRRWVDNIRIDLQEVGCGYVD